MGEEPERLRADAKELSLALHYQGTRGAAKTVDALLAEVERLARDNENIEEVYKRQLAEVVVDRARYRAEVEESEREVERLAGERDKAYRATGEYALRAKKAEAECERLAGRVAALETALREITRTPSRDWHKNARIARAALDVGGSERHEKLLGWIEDAPPKGNDDIGI